MAVNRKKPAPAGPSVARMRQGYEHHLRKIMLGLAVVMGLGMVSMFSGIGGNGQNKDEGRQGDVVASLAGKKLTQRDLDMVAERGAMGSAPTDPRDQLRLKAYAAQQFSDEAIKVDAAKKAGITVSRDELKAEKEKQYQQAAQRNQIESLTGEDKTQAENALRNQIDGQDDQIGDNLIVQKWENSFKDKVNLNDPKTKPEDLELRARHILVLTQDPKRPVSKNTPIKDRPLPVPEARKKIEEILTEVKKPNANFAELAKKFSQDPGSAPKGGDLDWFGHGQMVPEFEKAAFALKPGQTSGIVKTNYGFHIIRVEDRRVSEMVKQRMVDDYMKKARTSMKADVSDPALAGAMLMNQADTTFDAKEKAKLIQQVLAKFETAKQKAPGDPAVLGFLGDLYKRQYDEGKKKDPALRDKAIQNYELAVKATPAPRLRLDLAHLYEDANKKPLAVEQLKKASEVAFSDPSIRPDLQVSLERLGETKLAAEQKKILDEARKNQPNGFPAGFPGGGGSQSVPINLPTPPR